jgi:hypothetical protein
MHVSRLENIRKKEMVFFRFVQGLKCGRFSESRDSTIVAYLLWWSWLCFVITNRSKRDTDLNIAEGTELGN